MADQKTAVPAILSAAFLKGYDAKLKDDKAWAAVAPKYEKFLASDASIEKTKAALLEKKHAVDVVDSPAAALALLTSDANLPKGASVAFGGSITLEEIGFIDAVKARADLKNYRAEALAAMAKGDYPASTAIRVEGTQKADLFFTSLSALTESGELITADASGTRVAPMISGAKKVVLVVGANKIVANEEEGIKRLKEYIIPVEGAHMREVYKIPGTTMNNYVCVRGSFTPARFHIIIVKGHSLGY